MRKRKFSGMTLEQAMPLIGTVDFTEWSLNAPLRPPSDILLANLQRLRSFDTLGSEAAKLLLVDILLAEIVPHYPALKVWKGKPLVSPTLTGFADYLFTPRSAYVTTPLLCAAEAKKDDFEQGRAQCVAELAACREKNQAEGYEIDLFGFVSNGQTWLFYKFPTTGEIYETSEYNLENMPRLLGALDYLCAECAKRIP